MAEEQTFTVTDQTPDSEVLTEEEQDSLEVGDCLLYTSPSPRDYAATRMPSSA